MRAYKPKDNVQRKSYHSDRFYITPKLARKTVATDGAFAMDVSSLDNVSKVLESYIELDHLVMYVEHTDIVKAIKHLKEIRAYDFLIELTAVDYLASKGGFEIVYEMLSTSKHKRIRVKTFLEEGLAIEWDL